MIQDIQDHKIKCSQEKAENRVNGHGKKKIATNSEDKLLTAPSSLLTFEINF